jgi:hypothetical protein
VDVFAGRDAESFATWLTEHPGTQVICRVRACGYAAGARTGAPEAMRVAYRFHLFQNLAGAVEKTVAEHRRCPRETGGDVVELPAISAPPKPESPAAARNRERHVDVHELLERTLLDPGPRTASRTSLTARDRKGPEMS